MAIVIDQVALQLVGQQGFVLTDHTGGSWWQSLKKVRVLRQAWVGGLKSVLERAEQMTEVQKVVKQGVKRLGMGWCQNQVGEGAAVAVAVGILGCQGEGVEVGEGEGVGEVVGGARDCALVGPWNCPDGDCDWLLGADCAGPGGVCTGLGVCTLGTTGVGCANGLLDGTTGLKPGALAAVEGDKASTGGSTVDLRLLTRSCTSTGPFKATTE